VVCILNPQEALFAKAPKDVLRLSYKPASLSSTQTPTNPQPPDEYVIPGNIIFRQRGTQWHAGENVGIGRDHTIFSLHHGYVKYYRNPRLDPKKRYIGVVFDKTQTLPAPMNAARRRRLGMVAVARQGVDVDFEGAEADGGVFSHARSAESAADEAEAEVEAGADADAALKPVSVSQTPSSLPTKRVSRDLKRRALTGRLAPSTLAMTAGNHYNFRESNYQIGRVAERAGVQYKEFQKGDRFLAWRKKGARKARNAERRSLGSKKGSKREGKSRA